MEDESLGSNIPGIVRGHKRGKSGHFAMKEKFHEKTKRQGTTMYISFSTREKYLLSTSLLMRYLKIVIHVICGIFGKYRKE